MVTEFSPEAIDCLARALYGIGRNYGQPWERATDKTRDAYRSHSKRGLSALVEGGHVVPAEELRIANERGNGWRKKSIEDTDTILAAEARVDLLTQATHDLLDAYHPGLM